MAPRANEWVCGFEVGLGVLTNTTGAVCTPALPLEHSVQGGGRRREGEQRLQSRPCAALANQKVLEKEAVFSAPSPLETRGWARKEAPRSGDFLELARCLCEKSHLHAGQPTVLRWVL